MGAERSEDQLNQLEKFNHPSSSSRDTGGVKCDEAVPAPLPFGKLSLNTLFQTDKSYLQLSSFIVTVTHKAGMSFVGAKPAPDIEWKQVWGGGTGVAQLDMGCRTTVVKSCRTR